MGLRDFKEQNAVQLLQRSLRSGRLAHAYLFAGSELETLEAVARTLAKTLNCSKPVLDGGTPVDSCDSCVSCRKIETDGHSDVHWVRPESKMRVVTIDQVRELMHDIQLRPGEGRHKVGVIVAADRMNDRSANAFLKTLEEPPAGSVLILLTTEPQRILETIISRCLRLTFGGRDASQLSPEALKWVEGFSEAASGSNKSLFSRYKVLDSLLIKLAERRAAIEETLKARSPIERHAEAEKDLVEKWEEELKSAIEAEYRKQRFELLAVLQLWMRDVWLHAAGVAKGLMTFEQMPGPALVAKRIGPSRAVENLRTIEDLQWILQSSNVQEALALEVKLLRLHL